MVNKLVRKTDFLLKVAEHALLNRPKPMADPVPLFSSERIGYYEMFDSREWATSWYDSTDDSLDVQASR